MRITVAICTWNRCELLGKALAFLSEVTVPVGLQWEVLVVNNNSTDETDAVVRGFSARLPIRLLHEPAPGQSHARNRTLSEATGDYVAWIDDDVAVSVEWLEALALAISRFPDAAVLGGPVDPWFQIEPDPDLLVAFPGLARGFCGLDHQVPEGPLTGGRSVIGANMTLRMASVRDLRVDTRLGRSPTSMVAGEESDFIARLLAGGGRIVWVPRMRVRHYVEPDRMSLQYLLDYTFGGGKQHVLLAGIPEGSRLFGVPRWMVQTWAIATVRYTLHRALRNRRQALVALELQRRISGMMHGCRELLRREH